LPVSSEIGVWVRLLVYKTSLKENENKEIYEKQETSDCSYTNINHYSHIF